VKSGRPKMSSEELYPITVLIDELKNDDVQIRINSIKRLTTIALALGEARTRSELIPFLTDSLEDEDEVLLAVAEELKKFVPLVGGGEHAYTLLQPLEALAQVEETVVHDKAVEALVTIGEAIDKAHVEEHFFPLLSRLSADSGWAARVSASSLFATVHPKVGAASQKQLRKLYATLVEDEMPMVRRACASNLGKFAGVASMDLVKSDFIPLWVRLMADDQDNVRPLAVEAAIQLAKILSKEDNLALVVQTLHAASKDRSWRVRYTLANKYAELEAELGTEIAKTEMTPMLVRLLQDQEKEVRMAAALKIPSICQGLDNAERQTIIVTNVVQHVQALCTDASQHVRVSISASLLELGPILGKEKSVEILVPLFVALLKDDYFDVRLNIISKLNILQDVVGKEAVQNHILTEVVLLADDPQWRVRLAICEQMPMLARSLGKDGFDSAKLSLSAVCLNWLLDNVFAVRDCATKTVSRVCEVFGDDWAKSKIFPRITAMASEKAYLSRLTTLIAVKVMCEKAGADTATSVLLPIVTKLAKDTIPNVRFNAAQAIGNLVGKVDKSVVTGEVIPLLKEMTSDSDMDVKFYASSALATCA